MKYRSLLLAIVLAVALVPLASFAGDQDMRPVALTFVNDLVKGDYEAAVNLFDASVRGQVTPELLKQVWDTLQTKYGDYKSLGEPTQTAQGTYQCVYVPAVCQCCHRPEMRLQRRRVGRFLL